MNIKDLVVSFHFRMSADDYAYLVELSEQYNCSISQVVRKLIFADRMKRGQYDTKTIINNQL